jgi:hypothetical protein
VPTTIAESVAPISIDRCEATVVSQSAAGDELADYIDFTNVSSKTATEIVFALRVLDGEGLPQRTLTDERDGRYVSGVPIANPIASHSVIDALPASAKVSCAVLTVRFDDGSIWHEGDGPMGSGTLFTPPPQAPPTPSWHFPGEEPTPRP